MICASFSPGGLFLATGSADHHVRVYMMDGKVSLVFLDQLINVWELGDGWRVYFEEGSSLKELSVLTYDY